ncbi:MAG TPA: HupE/UreJ family protein [Vicinamibacterales bacterium]|nr:HupE/UreJ family protein [Vicinamibacterales bacterium]
MKVKFAVLVVPTVLMVLMVPSAARAHEIGKTQVTMTFRDAAYVTDVVVDPDALLTKLEIASNAPLSRDLDRSSRDRRIRELLPAFGDRITMSFDGTRDRPSVEYRPVSAFSDAAAAPSIVRLRGRVPAGAREVTFAYGLAIGSFAFNVRFADGPVQTFWLEGPRTSPAISLVAPPPPPTTGDVIWQYFGLGFTHIVPNGLDHILFVLGIFLLSARWRSVLLQVSTFTIAHSITLGLTMYGIVSLPAKVVEPMIALSIAYVAIENLVTSELKPWRLALVFSFGLLHGMGFAGVLRDLGLPRSEFLAALVSFNVGVEAGQLTVIALAFVAVMYWRTNRATYRRFVIQPASFAIAAAGVYWTIVRLM